MIEKKKKLLASKNFITLHWVPYPWPTFLLPLCFGESASEVQIYSFTFVGDLISTLSKHKGPIFSLKWNKKGDYLLTGSVDRTAVVWDVKAEEWKQQFEFHTGTIFLFFIKKHHFE